MIYVDVNFGIVHVCVCDVRMGQKEKKIINTVQFGVSEAKLSGFLRFI